MGRAEKRKAENRRLAIEARTDKPVLDTGTKIGIALGAASAILAAVLAAVSSFVPVAMAVVIAGVGFGYAISHHPRLKSWWGAALSFAVPIAFLLLVFSRPLMKLYAAENPPSAVPVLEYPEGGHPKGPIPFAITAGYDFTVIPTATGTAEFSGPFVKLSFTNLILRERLGTPDVRVVYVRPGIANWHWNISPHSATGQTGWNVSEWGENIELGYPMAPLTARTVPPFTTIVAYDRAHDMQHAWLVLEIGLDVGKGRKVERRVTYAHSERYLFHHQHKVTWLERIASWLPWSQESDRPMAGSSPTSASPSPSAATSPASSAQPTPSPKGSTCPSTQSRTSESLMWRFRNLLA